MLVPLGICFAAAALGGFRLGSKSLWIDEAFSDAMARVGLGTFWKGITKADAFHGTYYTFLHFWIRMFGDGESSLRAPSLIAGVLTVLFVFVLTRRLFGLRAAVVAGVLLAVNTFFISYEQEARDYAMVALASVVATLLFVRALERPSRWRWIGYGAASAAAIYIHAFAALVILAHLLSLPLRRARPPRSLVALGYATTAVLVAPLAFLVASTHSTVPRSILEKASLRSLESLFLEFTGGASAPSVRGRILLLLYFLACCIGVFLFARALARRREGSVDEAAWRFGLIILWLTVPVTISFAVSMARPIFLDRYLMGALPALVILAAVGISTFRARIVPVAAAVLVVMSVPSLQSYYGQEFKWGTVDWRAATDYVLVEQRAGDGVIFPTRYDRRAFEYYLRQSRSRADLTPVYPNMPWGTYTPVLSDLDVRPAALEAAALPQFRRVWVVLTWGGWSNDPTTLAPLVATLTRWEREPCRTFGPVLTVCLYTNPSS